MSKDPFLIPEATLSARDNDLRKLIAQATTEYAINIDDELYGSAFRNYLLFALWPNLLEGSVSELTAPICFYNKYYWFLRMKTLYSLKHGYDAGLEQQAFQLLESVDGKIDLSVTDRIEGQVSEEVGSMRK